MKLSTVLLASILCTSTLAVSSPSPSGRLVVFADKKEGSFKTDRSIKIGTSDNLQDLKKVEEQKGVHACFVGSPQAIKPILDGMVSNSNKSESKELKIKTFEADKNSLNVEVLSEKSETYLKLKIGPC